MYFVWNWWHALLAIIFLFPSFSILLFFQEERLRNRKTETEESLKKRLDHARVDMKAGTIVLFSCHTLVISLPFQWRMIPDCSITL